MSKKIKINGLWPIVLPDSSANEWLGNMKHHNNTWEMKRLKTLEAIVLEYIYKKHRNPIVLYIGAYKGDMAALMATWGAKLVIVESSPGFWPLIKETWELNNLPAPAACFSGLASRKNATEIDGFELKDWPERSEPFVEGTTGFSHLAESGGHFPEISIDGLVQLTGLIPDLITIDVEGSELEVCYGAIDTIQTFNPDFLISVHPEFMFHNHGTYERELHDLLRNNKYQGTWLDYDHEHHWLYEYQKANA